MKEHVCAQLTSRNGFASPQTLDTAGLSDAARLAEVQDQCRSLNWMAGAASEKTERYVRGIAGDNFNVNDL